MSIWTDLTGIDFCMKTVDAAGIPTRALQAGSGEAVIFLHGTSGHLEAFSRNISVHAAKYSVHAIDMLGHGYTGKPDYAYEIPLYAKHLADYMDACGIAKAHIVGESLGGWVGGRLAIDHPERVLSLQLVCSGGTKADQAVMTRIRTSTLEAVTSPDPGLTRKRLELLMHDPAANVSDELVDVRHAIYHADDFVKSIENLLCLQTMDVRVRNLLTTEDLGKIAAPTLVLWSAENPFGAVPEAHAMHAAIPGSCLEIFGECGHWPQFEQAEKYNALSLEFLAAASAVTA
jgi:2-hydroxy-6-oxonona-2,4-dienedioate hydrolase